METHLPDDASCELLGKSTRAAMKAGFEQQTIVLHGEAHSVRVFDPSPSSRLVQPAEQPGPRRRVRVEPLPDGSFAIREGCRPPFDVVPLERLGEALRRSCLGGADGIAAEIPCVDDDGPARVLAVFGEIARSAPGSAFAVERFRCPERGAPTFAPLPRDVAVELIRQEGPLSAQDADRAVLSQGRAVQACIDEARQAGLFGMAEFVVDMVVGARGGVASMRIRDASRPFGQALEALPGPPTPDVIECVGRALAEADVPGAGDLAEASYVVTLLIDGPPGSSQDR